MNWLSIAEQIAALDLSPIHIEPGRCLRTIDRHSTCDQCLKTCPTGALVLDKPVTLKVESCVLCGQCLHDCPVGALTGPDKVAEVWALASRPEKARVLEVACSRHPSPDVGPARTDTVLRLDTCLAALSPAAYVGLLSLGFEQVTARLDGCSACPIRTASAAIERTIATTRQLLTARQEADRVTVINTGHGQKWTSRPVYGKTSDLSRRDLFRRFSPKHQQSQPESAAQVFDAPDDDHGQPGQGSTGKQPPRERRRLLAALRRLPPVALSPSRLENVLFAQIAADENCSACGACARICPTGALKMSVSSGDDYQLTFSPGDCVNCGLCLKVCMPKALHREDPTLADLLNTTPVTRRAGTLQTCARCGAKFASVAEHALCPICEFRREHPFGTAFPRLRRDG